MNSMVKKAIMLVVGLLVMFGIFTGTLGDVITAQTAFAAVGSLPPILATISEFWWVGVLMVLLAVFLNSSAGRSAIRKYRNRR